MHVNFKIVNQKYRNSREIHSEIFLYGSHLKMERGHGEGDVTGKVKDWMPQELHFGPARGGGGGTVPVDNCLPFHLGPRL